MGLLDRARAWSNKTLQRNESVTVEYRRDGEVIGVFPARPSHPADLIDAKTSVAIATSDRDFIVNADALVTTTGERIEPAFDDRIVQDIGGRRIVFTVTNRNNDACYTKRDGGETSIRIHTKFYAQQ